MIRKYDGKLTFKIPGYNKQIAAPTRIEYIDDDNFKWFGEFENITGYITIICEDGLTFGHFHFQGNFFEIKAFDKDQHLLLEYDMDVTSLRYQMEPPESPPEDSTSTPPPSENPNSNIITLLALYTDAADNAEVGIEQRIYSAVSQMNYIIQNSIPNIDLSIVPKYITKVDFTEGISIGSDLGRLQNDPDIAILRDQRFADIVVLWTNGNYSYGGYPVWGVAGGNGVADFLDAYAIIEHDAPSCYYTFSHEVGHLLGGWDFGDNRGTYEFGYTFYTREFLNRISNGTVMEGVGTDVRYPGFSNPDEYVDGAPTGVENEHDMARKITESYHDIARFYDDFDYEDLLVNINGPSQGNPNVSYSWNALVSGGNTPYWYCWAYSTNGVDYDGCIDNDASMTMVMPNSGNLYLRVLVTSVDGQSAYGFKTIYPDALNSPLILEDDLFSNISKSSYSINRLKNNNFNNERSFKIYPNPVDDSSVVKFIIDEDTNIRLIIRDVYGSIVKEIYNFIAKKGVYTKLLNTESLSKGIYFLSLETDKSSEVIRISVI